MRILRTIYVFALPLVCVCSLTANVLLYQRYSQSRAVVRLGDSRGADAIITRGEYQNRLDYLHGKEVLNQLTYAKIVRQAALKNNVAPTDREVDDRFALVGSRQPGLLRQAQQDPARLALLRDEVWTAIALENLRVKNVKVSDAEIAAVYQKYRATLKTPLQVSSTVVVAENKLDAGTAAEMLRQKIAPDTIARQPRLRVVGVNGWSPNWNQLPEKLRAEFQAKVSATAPGSVAVIQLKDIFFAVRVNKRSEAGVPSLSMVRAEMTRRAQLAKAPPLEQTLAQLFQQAHVTFEVEKYAPFFEDIKQFAASQDDKKAHSSLPARTKPVQKIASTTPF